MESWFESYRQDEEMFLRGMDVFSEVTGGRALSFHDLSVGEAPAPLPKEGENGGGGEFPSQISHRKDQPGSPWNERKDTHGPHRGGATCQN